MKKAQTCARFLGAMIMTGFISHASAVELDSSLFNHLYDGNTHPVPGYTETTNWVVDPSTDGNILTYQGTIAEGGFWQSDQWIGGPNPVANSLGWTIEFRIRIRNDADDDAAGGAFNVFAKDVNGNNSQGRRAQVTIGKNWTKVSSSSATLYSTVENTNDYHVYRFGQSASSSSMYFWRDGVLLYNGLSRPSNDSSSLTAQMWWGDGSSGTGGPTVDVDYFRWDSTALYEPVVISPAVVQNPQNTTNAVGVPVTLVAVFTNAITSVQWYHNNNPVGANTISLVSTGQISTYAIASLQPSDEGTYSCAANNNAGLTNTAEAYVDVLTDVTPPTVISNLVSAWARRVRVKFSEPTDPVSAGEPTNYVFQSGALNVASVTVLDSTRVDVLTAEHPVPGSNYVMEISNVQDTSGNPIAANTPVAFTVGTNFPAMTNLLMAFNEASAVPNAGGGVAWQDLSGNENHAVNPSTTGPTLVSDALQGHGVFHFTPASTTPRLRVLGADATGLTENNYTWFVVARCTNRGTGNSSSLTPVSPMVFNYYSSYEPANWNCYFYNGGPETTNAQAQVEQGVVFAGRDDPGNNEVAAIPHPVPGDSWYILAGHVNVASGAIGRVLNPVANTVIAATNSNNPLGLGFGIPNAMWFGGNSGGGNRFGGDMAEILIYTGTLTQNEWDSVENYLRVKYFPPYISVNPSGANLEVTFTGILQSSTNGVNGTYYDVSGNPPSPYAIAPGSQLPEQYFRSRHP